MKWHLTGATALGLLLGAGAGLAGESPQFDEGTTMRAIQDRGKLILGTKYDSPGYSLADPATGQVSGFDVEVARILAKKLGLGPEDIEFKETVSKNREPFVINGLVDVVIAAMAITDARREVIGQAGPYYVAGTQLIVHKEDADRFKVAEDMAGAQICATTGGTPIAAAKRFGADAVAFDTYDECVQQLLFDAIDGVLVGGGVAYGYSARNPNELTVTMEPFDPQRLSIALRKDDVPFCAFIREALQESFEDGTWAAAFDETLGAIGAPRTDPPVLDARC